MLPIGNPKRRVSQAPLKESKCAVCDVAVYYRTAPRLHCAGCIKIKKAEQARRGAEVQRRKRGVPKVKGRTINCASCGVLVTLSRNAHARFCPPCSKVNNAKDSPRRSAAKRATVEGREYANQWARNKRATDPSAKITAHMRVMIGRGLKGGKAWRSWKDFLPYTLDELMAHLERQFLPGMTWANKGEWHIDHIVPIALHSYETADDPEFQAAWALANLRPLWARDNLRKNARRTHLI